MRFEDTDLVVYASTTYTFTVRNEAGTSLPSTGGPGTRRFFLPGSILALSAALFFIVKRQLRQF